MRRTQLADRCVATWENVPEYSTSNSNTFQVEMFFSGVIRVSYLAIAAVDGIAGLSAGSGLSPDFLENDLTSGTVCQLPVPQAAPAPHNTPKNRYITFDPNNDLMVALELSMTTGPGATGVLGWVGAPAANGVSRVVAAPVYRLWSEPYVHVADCPIVPAAIYELRATIDEIEFSDPFPVGTIAEPTPQFWADCVGDFGGGAWSGPNGTVNFHDIDAAVKVFQGAAGAADITWVDLHPEIPNYILNFSDISMIIAGFQGNAYLFADPADCP